MNITANQIYGEKLSRTSVRVGRILSGIAIALLGLDCLIKLVRSPEAVEGTVQLGYRAGLVQPLGLVQLLCLIAYAIPRTSIVGAVLLTGYFGGAIATHVRMGNPLFTHILSPIYIAIIVWGGLYLRDRRVRALVNS